VPDAPAARPAPVVFRPRRLRVVAWVITVVLCAVTAFGWFALPGEIRVLFSFSQRLTLLGVLAALVLVMLAVAASSVRVDDDGLRIRNGLRTHTVSWSRVQQVMLRPGDPWAFLLLKPADGRPFSPDLDAEKRYLVALQAGDGAYAAEAVAELRRRLLDAVTRSRAT
jgi:hypothetical protein